MKLKDLENYIVASTRFIGYIDEDAWTYFDPSDKSYYIIIWSGSNVVRIFRMIDGKVEKVE